MMSKFKSRFNVLLFFVRNLTALHKVVEIKSIEIDGLVFRGYSKKDADSVSSIYRQLNDKADFSWVQRVLYKFVGSRCFFIVEQKNHDGTLMVCGINMYYLNNRDIQDNTIHEGFIGVMPKARGRGIATKMRQMAVSHFRSAGFSGMSTRISLDNMASLVSARKNGFRVIDEYEESSTGDQRYYMILKF